MDEHDLRSARATLVAVALLVSAKAKLYSNNRYSDWGRFDDQKAVRIAASLSIVLLLQSGCATVQRTPEANGVSIVVKELVKTTKSWDGQLLLAYPQGQPEITIRWISIPAGARLDIHSHLVINAGVLITGQLTVMTVDGKTLDLKAGEPIVEVVNTLHYGISQGDVPAEIVVFYAGAVDTPIPVVKSR